MKNYFGDEYPAAITVDGVRMPLVSERRWTRIYTSNEPKMSSEISRFMDGSATITFQEFARDWPRWSKRERHDFCGACPWLHEQPDYPDILRYIMQHGDHDDWSAIASSVGTRLPQDEAFELLTRVLSSSDLASACNISQGISLTKHPDAEGVLRAHLDALWSHPSLWDDDDFNNWFPHISPDGHWMVFLSYEKDVSGHPENKDVMLRLMSLQDKKISVLARLFGGQGTINVPSWSPDSKQVAFVSYELIR